MYNFNNKIYSNNNDLLLDIIDDLKTIITITKDNSYIKRIKDIITKINNIINENKKNTELIINHISLLQNQMNQMLNKFDEIKFNNINQINNQTIKYTYGIYRGQIVNGLKEGRGIFYWNNGDKYEGDWKSDKPEGKGILLLNNGDKYEGDWRNGKKEGKGIYYYNDGNRYEGDWKNDKKEGEGIRYFKNGNRGIGDFYNGNPIGKHIMLSKNGEVDDFIY